MGTHMHAVASKAVAGTVTGLPIWRVPRAKTDEAESAFALVVHGALLASFGLCIGLTSRHRIRIASAISSSHVIYHQPFRYQFFFFKSSQVQHAFVLLLIHPPNTRLFYHYRFYPALDFFFVPTMSPRPRYPPIISISVRAHDLL